MKYLLFYEPGQDIATRGAEHMAAHGAWIDEFHERGVLLGVGVLDEDPQSHGALALFTTREAAEEFAKDDPFVLTGVVRSWRVVSWKDILDS